MRQELKQRISELTRGFFRGKLRLTPQSVEVGDMEDTLVVRVKGFLAPAERAMADQPNDRSAIEDYYLRLFDQIAPLMRTGVAEAGPLVKFQTLLDLARDECVFILTLGKEGEVTRVDSS
jgi:uncharacterized protein YbcI